jgi:hypothetical protein
MMMVFSFANFDSFGLAQISQRHFSSDADFFGTNLTAGQRRRCLPRWFCGDRRSLGP